MSFKYRNKLEMEETVVLIDEFIQKRFSPKAFASQAVSKEVLEQLFEAARQAPSSYNEQPWRFIYATKDNQEAYEKLLACLNEKNQSWAQHAPVLMLSIAKTTFTKNGKINRHAWHDTGMAVAFLSLKATELDLYIHQMAGFYPEKAKELLHIPEGYEPVAMAALGYLGEEENPNKGRKPIEEIAFEGKWQS